MSGNKHRERPTRSRGMLLARLLSALLVLAVTSFLARDHLQTGQLLHFTDNLGLLAPVAFIPLSALVAAIFVPPGLLIVVGWLVFGIGLGAFYSVLGMTAGSCLALLGWRYLIGESEVMVNKGRLSRTLAKVDEVMKYPGILTTIGLRLIFFGNAALDYSVSRRAIMLRDYVVGTLIGLMPRAVVLSYLLEEVLRPAVAAVESPVADAPLPNLLYEHLIGKASLEHAFIWSTLLISTRICGVILLAVLVRSFRVSQPAQS